ncbi:hypothetical protein B0H14DRAFT_2639183 [Mycena olivaceomarginata]|nr:hypothetical protein B0H14DRAFT_2639183 [Mycena olivaceomarginata]
MPVALLNASGPIATLEESVHRQWQCYAAGAPLDVEPTFSAAPQSEYYGSVFLPNGQRLHRSAGPSLCRVTNLPFTSLPPDDPQRIWDLELCYPSDERLSAAMATLPSIEGQEPLSYPVHATKQAPPMIPLGHRVATGQGEFKVATADTVMMKSQTSVSPEELVEDPGSPFRGRARSPFSAIIMGPHGARFEAAMARDIYQRARDSLRLNGDELFSSDSESDSLPDLVSITDSSQGSESVDVDLGICQFCFEIHPPAPWDCPLFGITESQKANKSRESGTAVGSDTSAEKVGDKTAPDESECVLAKIFQDSLAVKQEAEVVRRAFKDFTIAFDTPENENEQEFRSVVDMLEHEAADGLRALAAGLRVEHAAVDELREIEDGLRRLETEERTADPVRDDSPYPRLIRETRGYARARAQRPTAILQRAQRPPIAFHFNPRAGDVITRDAWSSSASDSLDSSSPEPLTPYDNDDHDAALNERYLPGSRFPSDLNSNNSREDAEAAAEFPQSEFSPRLDSRDPRSEQIRLELQSWTYECNAHRLTHLQHEDKMGSDPANAALRALHGPLSKFVDYVAMAAEGRYQPTPPAIAPRHIQAFYPVGQGYEEEGFAGQVVGTLAAGADAGKRDAEGEGAEVRPKTGTKRKLSDGEAAEGEDRDGTRKRKSPKTSKFFGDSLRRKVLNQEAVKVDWSYGRQRCAPDGGSTVGLAGTGSRLEDMVWHRYGVTNRFFPSCYLHHPLLFDLEVAKLQNPLLLSIRLRNEYVVSHVLNVRYIWISTTPRAKRNYWDLLEDPGQRFQPSHRTFSTDQIYEHSEAERNACRTETTLVTTARTGDDSTRLPRTRARTRGANHHGLDRCRRCGKRLAVSCPTLTDPGTNALGLTL